MSILFIHLNTSTWHVVVHSVSLKKFTQTCFIFLCCYTTWQNKETRKYAFSVFTQMLHYCSCRTSTSRRLISTILLTRNFYSCYTSWNQRKPILSCLVGHSLGKKVGHCELTAICLWTCALCDVLVKRKIVTCDMNDNTQLCWYSKISQ